MRFGILLPILYGITAWITVIFGLHSAWARQDLMPGSRYTSARGAAMGDAFLPLGDDAASGLFYNPANLARIRRFEVEPLNISAYGNMGYVSMLDLNFYRVGSIPAYQPTLDSHVGTAAGGGVQVFPNLAVRYFSFGILFNNELRAQRDAAGTITYRSLYQLIPAFGTGVSFLDGIFRIGYSLQLVNQASGTRTVDPATSSVEYYNGLAQGTGISQNFGLAISLPIFLLPQFNFVVRNAFDVNYFPFSPIQYSPNSTGTPPSEPMTIDGSISLHPRFGSGVEMNLVAQYRDMTNRSGNTLMGSLAFGLEFLFGRMIYLRGGYSGGYFHGGLGMRRKGTEVSLSYYTEELGPSYLSAGDSRLVLQYCLRTF